jgi:hypothetical protein
VSDVLLLRRVACLLLALTACGGAAAASAVPDPTRPAIALPAPAADDSVAPAAALVLQSTLVSPRQRTAIINGQRYRAGDRIGDARLEAIGPGWVRLATPTGRTELRLSYSSMTRPVNR